MDPRHSAQDVVRCALCRDALAPMYCSVCHTHLCKDCVEEHFSDKSKVHTVVPLEQFLSTLNYPKCPTHPTKQCELHCEQCDIPICSCCISSGKHIGHKAVDIFEDFESKKEVLRKDLEELEKSIFPKYQESAAIIKTQKADQHKHSQKLTAELYKQGEALHREINTIIQRKHAEINSINVQHLTAIEKQEDVINKALHEINQGIVHLKSFDGARLLETNNIDHVSKYKSKNEDFRNLPPKLKISLPNFQPQRINNEQLLKQFGSLSSLSIEAEEQVYTLSSPGAEASPPARSLLDVPHLVTDIPTSGYVNLYHVSRLSDEEIWTSGNNKIMKLYNLKGELLKSVLTKSGNNPKDIAVTRNGGLVYADYNIRSINLVSSTQIQTLITLRGWTPLSLCSRSCGDLLVTMRSDDNKQTKVARYSGSTEKQTIQWDDQGKPLYSSNPYGNIKNLSENRNSDICVADFDAYAVVVVSAAGKLRFRYTGPPSTPRESFRPLGITTDSQGNILTSDYNSDRIHIIDQDGHFLRLIHNLGLQVPWGLCVDSRDNLFVAERSTGNVKKIMYYK
uniref:E3 ubiquitin-protein ligase TRIM71-like n=1 Tax=Crassostrea virginica TaxID=6565 RepID=A0A8B8BML2_CRAVI|nr:E3 ubiquitin-protein ligase TRIM71-like [Crassostrea virginica]